MSKVEMGDLNDLPGKTSAKEAAPGGTYEALAAAHSRALSKLSADIAATIRKAASEKQ